MNYLNPKLQAKLLPNFNGIKVHEAKINYSIYGEHEVSFKYYQKPEEVWFSDDPNKIWCGGTCFTNKKDAMAFIKLVNKTPC